MKFENLEKYRSGGTREQMELRIPLPKSPSGKVYRWCPVSDCQPNLFLLGNSPETQEFNTSKGTEVRRLPNTDGTTCPYCGHDDHDEEFTYRDDIEAVRNYVGWLLERDVHEQMGKIAKDFNRKSSSRGGLISIKMNVKPRTKPRPLSWREDLLRNLECDICGREYGVYAIALFCPDCGGKNLANHFGREVELVTKQVELTSQIQGEYGQEFSYRLLGNAHEDVLTAFEAYLKAVFKYLARHILLPEEADPIIANKSLKNKFQNIEKGRELFRRLDIDPYEPLSSNDLNFLSMNIQKRHIIGHNLSLVDEFYAAAAEGEQPGQTVALLGDEILRFANTCARVIAHLECHDAFSVHPAQT